MNILIAGDYAAQASLARHIEERKFSEVFPKDLQAVIQSADFSFVNFECPIVGEGSIPIKKCGPNLQCTPESVEAIKFAGFTGVTMANNHILDFGAEGLRKSVGCCKAQGLDVVGVGDNLNEAGRTLYLKKNGNSLAVINCCEHEFSIATESSAGANPLNPIQQFYAIQEAKKKVDYVLVIVHGGHEHFQLPSPRMQETYRFFIDAGADVIVNHYQHCYSGYEVYKGKAIFYGLGNFCFDAKENVPATWNEGYMVRFELENNSVNFTLHPYVQCKENVSVELLKDTKIFAQKIKELNNLITDPQKLRKEVEQFYLSAIQAFKTLYQPYENRILNKLYRMHLLPSLVSKRKYIQIYNYLICEAHRDKELSALKKIIQL